MMNAGIKRYALIGAGGVALLLGIVGIVVPGLPTTPFILLAAACFARASPDLHARLLTHAVFGPMVRDWETHHSLPQRIKLLAIGLMLSMVALSAWQLAGRTQLQALVIVLGGIGAWVVGRIPRRETPTGNS